MADITYNSNQSHFSVTLENLDSFKISTRLLLELALRRGYEVTYYPSSPSTMDGIVKCEKEGREFFLRSTCTSLTPSLGVYAAENKALTYALLEAHGVRVPKYVAMISNSETPHDVYAMLEQYAELVVKPVHTNHGDGITIGVASRERLNEAIEYARKYCRNEDDIIVQEQVHGREYRFLVVEGKTIAVAYRIPPYVIGDGISTIRELVNQKNLDSRRSEGHSSVLTKIDIDDVIHYGGKNFLEMIPRNEEKVNVLATSNLSRGGEAIDCTDIASKELKEMAAKAAQVCFLGVAGVDIMTNDIMSSSLENSYVIEVNLTPGLRMHQSPSVGKPRDVALSIFRAVEKTATVSGRRVTHIGRVEKVKLLDEQNMAVHARIDSGATISSIWASEIHETQHGLSFKLFADNSPYFTGKVHVVKDYSTHAVSSSMGQTQLRYRVRLRMSLKGRQIKASFTLADRATQTYPILIGRNILRNKFIVDVARGDIDRSAEIALQKRKTAVREGE
jgi:D-alanine-D-alanine ligase-like ATP-grasp enzyme